MVCPVTKEAASEHNHRTPGAISSGWPIFRLILVRLSLGGLQESRHWSAGSWECQSSGGPRRWCEYLTERSRGKLPWSGRSHAALQRCMRLRLESFGPINRRCVCVYKCRNSHLLVSVRVDFGLFIAILFSKSYFQILWPIYYSPFLISIVLVLY